MAARAWRLRKLGEYKLEQRPPKKVKRSKALTHTAIRKRRAA